MSMLPAFNSVTKCKACNMDWNTISGDKREVALHYLEDEGCMQVKCSACGFKWKERKADDSRAELAAESEVREDVYNSMTFGLKYYEYKKKYGKSEAVTRLYEERQQQRKVEKEETK